MDLHYTVVLRTNCGAVGIPCNCHFSASAVHSYMPSKFKVKLVDVIKSVKLYIIVNFMYSTCSACSVRVYNAV